MKPRAAQAPRSAVSSGPGGRTHHGSQASGSSGQAQGRPSPDHGHVAVRRRHRAARPLARRLRAQPPRPRQYSRHRRRRGARAARRGRRRDRARPHAPRGAAAHRGRLRRGRRRGEERGRAAALSALGGPRAPYRRGGRRRHRRLARGRGRRRRRGGRRLGAAARGGGRGRRHGRRRAPALRGRPEERRAHAGHQGGRPRRRLCQGASRGEAADGEPAPLGRADRGTGRPRLTRLRQRRHHRVVDAPGAARAPHGARRGPAHFPRIRSASSRPRWAAASA